MRVFVRLPAPPPPELRARLASRGWTPLGPDEVPGDLLWLRGLEAAGPVPDTTALVMIRAAARQGRPWVAEGLGPAAAAAALAVGAAGVVIDAATWLAEGVPGVPDDVRPWLRQATTGRDSTVRGELDDARERVLGRGPVPWPVPQTVAEAARYAGRDVLDVVDAVLDEVRHRLAEVPHHPLASDPLGTGRPVVQGPMANVSEATGLARAVRAAGGMPFAALGALDPDQARGVLQAWAADVPRPWGAGVIGFDVMPFRDAHLQAVAEVRPDAVLIAGGSIALATSLQERGLAVWLHTPSGRLVAQALAAGVRAVVLEGHEAGGHVGALTSVGLWEEGLKAVEAHLDGGGSPPLVVLAGGVGDEVSAAFAAAMAAPAVRRGAKVALQAGTAFFFTHEIVEAGQITAAYQAQALACRRTVLAGSSVNLPLRVPPGPYADEARALELELAEQRVARAERRARLEHHNLGRTRIAAKGIERAASGEGRRYRPVAVAQQLARGAFTMGQGAAVCDRLDTVAGVVARLGEGAAALLDERPRARDRWGPVVSVRGAPAASAEGSRLVLPTHTEQSGGAIAVVGLGCVLPGALDVPSYWRLLVEGRDAVGPVDEERWGRAGYFDPGASHEGPVRTYARHAGHIRGFTFDPLKFRIPPSVLPTVDPSQRLALAASAEAVARAGWDRPGRVDPQRAAVVLGNAMGGEFAKSMSLRVRFREVLAELQRDELARGWTASDLAGLEQRIEARLAERLPPVDVDSMAGLLSNVVAGRVAAWLDWMGGNLTVDAACAASLAAVAVAVDWLRTGRCDTVLAGGVDTDMTPESYIGFSRTHALSPTGSSPFSRHADGFVMGEGAAVLALKRLEDALRDGDPVWAVLRGVGQASDGRGRGITAPRAEGQALALRRACDDAGLDPRDLGMVEAHGTGTALGDRTEVGVLARHLRDAPAPVWLGSVKSMIGHLKGAAGAAGLTKAVLAVRTGIVPPTLHAGPVAPDLGLQDSPFRLPRAPVALPDDRRRAGVSAFGFGGTNFHVVLEAPPEGAAAPGELAALVDGAAPLVLPEDAAAWSQEESAPLLLGYAGADLEALASAVAADLPATPAEVAAAPVRMVVLAEADERPVRLERAARWLRDRRGPPPPGTWFGQGDARPITLLFPGQGAQRAGAITSLRRLPAGARALAAVEALLDGRVLDDTGSSDPVHLHATLFALGVGWAAVLREAGVPLAATVGHSLGAYAALVAAGAWRLGDAVGPVLARGEALLACPPGAMLAVRLDVDEAQQAAEQHGLVVAACNAPGSTVLAGPRAAVHDAAAALGPTLARPLAVERAYHSPAVASAARAVAAVLQGAPPARGAVPTWSSRAAAPVADPAEDLVRGIVEPVRFHATVEAMLAAGLGPLVEVGPGTTLTRLAAASGADALALDPTPDDRGRGVVAAAAALLARGHAGLVEALPGTLVALGLPAPRRAASPPPADVPVDPRIAVPAEPPPDPPDDLRTAVLDAICEVTGYPPDYIDDGADLEGDLGVDSIRKMEILGLLEQRLGFTTAEADYARLAGADLGALVAHVRERLEAPGAAPSEVRAGAVITVAARRLVADAVASSHTPRILRIEPGFEALAALDPEVEVAVLPAGDPACAAYLRSLAREQGRPIRLVHVEPGAGDDRVRAEVTASDRPPEVFVGPSGTTAPASLVLRPAAEGIEPDQVWVVSGGTGIATACLLALADRSPRVALLGRRSKEQARDTLERLRAAGIEAAWLRCDVTDEMQVHEAVGRVRARWGRIDAVLHAAAVLRDGPAAEQTLADRAAVWAVKVDGARHLAAATAADSPALWCVFSSLVAHLGNPGQTAYAAANAAAEALVHPTAARSLAIAWTAWSDVGMAADPALQRLLTSRGVAPLAPSEGAAAFRALVGSSASGPVRVAAQRLPDTLEPAWPLAHAVAWGDRPAFHLPLDPGDPALTDHQVGGRPLVPAAVWVAAMVQAARLTSGRSGPWSVEGLEITAPTFVDRPRDDVSIALQPTSGGWSAHIRAGGTVVCRATVGACAAPELGAPPEPLEHPEPASPLYRPDLLFHGPTWRVLERIVADDGDGRVRADLRAATTVAGAVDGAHQALCAWSDRANGWLGLPVGAARWVCGLDADGPLRLEARAAASGRALEAEVTVLDGLGRVVLRGEGVRLEAATRGRDG